MTQLFGGGEPLRLSRIQEEATTPVPNEAAGLSGERNTSSEVVADKEDRIKRSGLLGGVAAVHLISATPLLLLTLPLLALLCSTVVAFVLVAGAQLLAFAIVSAPLVLLLAARPKLLLAGYEPITEALKLKQKRRESRPEPSRARDEERGGDDHGGDVLSLLDEVRSSLSMSQFVYMYIEFRQLVIQGKLPFDFAYIMLESDEITTRDVIQGVPHACAAFGPRGDARAGIRPSALFVSALRFLVAESERHLVEKNTRALQGGSRIRRGTRRDTNRDSVQRRGSITSITETVTSFETAQANSRGLAMFDAKFLQSLKDTSYSCDSHVDGGLLCSDSGLHGMACFVDALHKEADRGDKNCEELQELLSTTGAFNELLRYEAFDRATFDVGTAGFEAETERMGSLLHAIAKAGRIFKHDSSLYSTFMDMAENDQRIVWTNDQSLEAECAYIIVVSHKKRRVTVIFRGTVTLNDVLQDVSFNALSKDNPVMKPYPGRTNSIELNNGFGKFLLSRRDDTQKSKFDEISSKALEYGKELGEGGFSLHVTGHSLGGALACIFGLYASVDGAFAQEGNPVRVITFAAPFSGRISFAKAFQCQEKAGLLQHLRIATDTDMVPILHNQRGFTYAHTGIAISLHEHAIPSVKYVQDLDWWGTWTANLLTNMYLNCPWLNLSSIGKSHTLATYAERLEQVNAKANEQGLGMDVTLDDLYSFHVHTRCSQK